MRTTSSTPSFAATHAQSLPRILTIAEHPRMREPRKPVSVVHETPVSALIDGGNYVGLYAVHRATQIALEKARTNHFAVVGMHNSYLSDVRNAYYLEILARAGFVGIHLACSEPVVAPAGGREPAFGTNPIAFGLPGEPDPLIFDMSTSAVNHGDVVLAKRLQELLPAGVALNADGVPTRDPAAALAGSILPFGGHKGHGLSLMIQAFGLLAGSALPRGRGPGFRISVRCNRSRPLDARRNFQRSACRADRARQIDAPSGGRR